MDWLSFINAYQKEYGSPVMAPLLKKTRFVELSGKTCIIGCENLGIKLFLDGKKTELESALKKLLKQTYSIVFVVTASKKRKPHQGTLPLIQFQGSKEEKIKKSGLHPLFTFENFAVSPSNHIAHAAAQAVADRPGSAYNPLFIYGSVGVGKTHLSQSIAHKILDADSKKKIVSCSSEQFTNDLVECIREKNTKELRRKYRSLDVLIIDDIQFIAGKNYVQEEFYHTFNAVVQSGGQIIVTSDRPPKEIKELEDRLRSRFSGGLIIDIQKPDIELRTAILLIKAKERNIDIEMEAARHLAEKVKDTRELEGTLLKLFTLAFVKGKESSITIETTKKELRGRIEEISKRSSPKDAIRAVASYYDLSPKDIKGASRKEKVALARQICMYILRTTFRLKLSEVAFLLKRRDHTTVIHGERKIMKKLLRDAPFKEEVESITESLLST